MKIMIIGAAGTIGSAVTSACEAAGHQIVRVGRTSGEYQVEQSDPASIRALFAAVGRVDAIVSCAGQARFKPLAELADDDFAFSFANKLMGQINLARIGAEHVADGGSITLTSGVLAQEPIPGSAAIALVNAGLEGFARAAALELPRALRINIVSPPWVDVTLVKFGMPPDGGYPASTVAKAYVDALTGSMTGQTLDARTYA